MYFSVVRQADQNFTEVPPGFAEIAVIQQNPGMKKERHVIFTVHGNSLLNQACPKSMVTLHVMEYPGLTNNKRICTAASYGFVKGLAGFIDAVQTRKQDALSHKRQATLRPAGFLLSGKNGQ